MDSIDFVTQLCLRHSVFGSFADTGSKPIAIARPCKSSIILSPFITWSGAHRGNSTPLLVAYPVEIWPYNLRARGLSLVFLFGQSSSFPNTFVSPIALAAIGWKYYLVFVVVLIAGSINIWFFYPETRGHSLEETAVVFDNQDAAASTADEVFKKVAQNQNFSHVGIADVSLNSRYST
ncbi:hypothetical protein ANO14919_135600 [Xylariales sp. No.14919]|nr:hypothetical protein ANO14919_135600 [Xylariales sp. No.14919]